MNQKCCGDIILEVIGTVIHYGVWLIMEVGHMNTSTAKPNLTGSQR